jgi:DNA-binding transcriptional ArsR family regulator
MARAFTHPNIKDITLDGILHALADPIRRQIISKLAGCPDILKSGMSCTKTCDQLSPSTISFHYRVLREAGLVRSQKKGVEVINTFRKDDIEKKYPALLESILEHHKPQKTR